MNSSTVDPQKYLPLTETTYYILVSLHQPLHGYGIMQYVGELSGGRVRLGPGTLYTAISKFVKEGLILPVEQESSDERRKSYILSERGKKVIQLEFQRLKALVQQTETVIVELSKYV